MTDKQENLFSMFTVLYGYLSTRQSIVTTVPAFQRGYERLGALIGEIKRVDSIRPSIKAGKSETKTNLRNELASAMFQISSALYTYADEMKDAELRERTDRSESSFKKMRDTQLIMEAKDLVRLTEGREAALADHGLTAEEIADVISKAAAYETAIQSLGTSEGESMSATASVYQLIGEAKDLIDNQLDRHADRFKGKHPDFYNQYYAARRIIDLGVRHEKKEEEGTPA